MTCPRCQHLKTEVVDSRESLQTIRRRRECRKCGHRFTTYELSDEQMRAFQQPQKDEQLRIAISDLLVQMSAILATDPPEAEVPRFRLKA